MMDTPSDHSDSCKNCDSCKINVFCDLESANLEIIEKNKLLRRYKKGQSIFYAGNFPSGVYCVKSGVIKLEAASNGGNNHILEIVQAGGILGYKSLFADEAHAVTAVVHEDATACYIPKSAMLELLNKFPAVGLRFISRISKELKASQERLCGLTDRNAAERIAEAILFLSSHYQNQTWTRKEIAEWAGTTPETVMRTLADFASEQIVELVGRKINILKRDSLMRRANLSH